MKYSHFLKSLRSDNGLSQIEMVEFLSLHHAAFSDVTVVTYSRWERGISVPPLVKMLYVAHIFNIDAFDFLTTIEFKSSATQTTAFDNLLNHFCGVSDHFRLLSARIIDEEEFIFYGPDNYSTSLEAMRKVKNICSVVLRQTNSSTDRISIDEFIELQKSGALHFPICINSINNEIIAQGAYILQSTAQEGEIIKHFENNSFSLSEITKLNDEDDKILFIPAISLYSSPWFRFNLYNLFKTFTRIKNIKKIYLVTTQQKASSKYKYLGFNIEKTTKSKIKSKIGGSIVYTDVSLYLQSCNFDDLISNHGLVNFAKNNNMR